MWLLVSFLVYIRGHKWQGNYKTQWYYRPVGTCVMADKGFDIEDLLHAKRVSLIIPPFLESQGQFSAQDVQKTKTIARLRIHVERAIRRVKEYHVFWLGCTIIYFRLSKPIIHCSLPPYQFPRPLNFIRQIVQFSIDGLLYHKHVKTKCFQNSRTMSATK